MAKKSPARPKHTFDARPDTVDFRDRMFVPTLTEVLPSLPLSVYQKAKTPILDQGAEGACTGFGLAAVANYLLHTRRNSASKTAVSPRMLYQMARRYDEWPGEDYDGSSARGAMKGWHKHGVCAEQKWPYEVEEAGDLTAARIADAVTRPLGAYFRVNHKDLVAMHCAITEVGILYATASVHAGWDNVGGDGMIALDDELLGGHAFAIVAYDQHGFWIQNSWGESWGAEGFARISYDDWLINGTDVWVARLGVPIEFDTARGIARAHEGRSSKTSAFAFQDLRPHVVTIGNNGRLATKGQFANSAQEVASIFSTEFPRITNGWKKKRILLYAHGGLVGQDAAIQRLADYRPAMLAAEIYPLAFIWRTDYWSTVTNMLRDALSQRKPEGILDAAKDFMLDRLDDGLEPIARALSGKASWDEMKENALLATTSAEGGVRHTIDCLAALAAQAKVEIHVAGHSAGSILHGPAVELLTAGLGLQIKTCTLWAPACTTELFRQYYLPAVKSGAIAEMAVFVLSDSAEQDDHCAQIYHKSLLYLVSNAFEAKMRNPIGILDRDGTPILGMEKFFPKDKRIELVVSPNREPMDSRYASRSTSHGGFDDDEATLKATLARILGNKTSNREFVFNASPSHAKDTRLQFT